MSSGAKMEAIDSIKRIWEANDVLWNRRVIPLILEPLEKNGGLDTNGLWDHVLATAFGRSQKTFESIQLLCDPALPRRFWDDAFVLTRSHYENFVTMEWIAQDPGSRSQLFWDEYALKQAHFLEALGADRDDVRRERREEIIRDRDEALKRHGRRSGTLQLLPSLQERVRSLAEPLKNIFPNLEREYELYYRDVSGFAHPSGWGTALSLTESEDSIPTVECSPRVGYNAVILNGDWIFRILRCWNKRFQIVSEETVNEWHREWVERSGVGKL